MHQKLLISGILVVGLQIFAGAGEPQQDGTVDSPLRQFQWLIGEWEHVNDDGYNSVEHLEFKWGKDEKSIEATYRYTLNPGFCETGYFRCSETITALPGGNLSGRFEFEHLEGWGSGSDIKGSYRLSKKAESRWEGKCIHDKIKKQKKKISDLILRKTSDTRFEFVTSAAWSKGTDYSYEFQKKPKTE